MDSLPHSEVGPGEKPIDQPSLDYFFEQKYFSLLKSFESIFNLLQRSEESRSHVEELCRILVTSRTVTGLIAGVGPHAQRAPRPDGGSHSFPRRPPGCGVSRMGSSGRERHDPAGAVRERVH